MRASIFAILAMLGWFATYVHLQSKVERQSEKALKDEWFLDDALRSSRHAWELVDDLRGKLQQRCEHHFIDEYDELWEMDVQVCYICGFLQTPRTIGV